MAIAEVQHKASTSSASSVTSTCTVTSTGAGHLLIVALGNNAGRTVVSVSDGTNNFVQVPSAHASGGNHDTDVWWLASSTSGKVTITVTWSGSAAVFVKDIWFWEVSGFTTPIVDVVAIATPAGATTLNGASVTTTAAVGFVVGVVVDPNSVTVNPKAGNEFTAGGDIVNGDAGCSLISASAAAHQPVWTSFASGGTAGTSTVAFKESAPSGDVLVKVGGAFVAKPSLVKIGGAFSSKPALVKVGGSWV